MTTMNRRELVQVLADRRAVRRRPGWSTLDRLLALVLVPLLPLMFLYPVVLADIADTVILDVRLGGLDLSPLLLSLLRLLVITFAAQAALRRRASSWYLRLALVLLLVGLSGNWGRDHMYDTPLTLSLLVLQCGLALVVWYVLAIDDRLRRAGTDFGRRR